MVRDQLAKKGIQLVSIDTSLVPLADRSAGYRLVFNVREGNRLTVADVERTVDFYVRVLGMRPVVFEDGRRAVSFGTSKINLHEAGREWSPRAARDDDRARHERRRGGPARRPDAAPARRRHSWRRASIGVSLTARQVG